MRHCYQLLCARQIGNRASYAMLPNQKRGQASGNRRSINLCCLAADADTRGTGGAPNIFYLSKVGSILYFRLRIPPAFENCFLIAASLQSIVCSRHIARIAYIARALNWMIRPIGNWAIIETRSLAFANRNQKPKIRVPDEEQKSGGIAV